MPSTTVLHAGGSYQVHVVPGITAEAGRWISELMGGRRMAVVTDPAIRGALNAAKLWPAVGAPAIEVSPGERAKSRETWARITDELLSREFGRDSALVAVGGGSIGDLAGFVAATYLRGVPFVQVPTTLLAMVDASVGGKVGVDTPAGKNLIGAFHPPALVLADPKLLLTLPDQTYREGLAEALKHGLVADAEYFNWMVQHAAQLVGRDSELVAELVARSVEIKAAIVGRDEREQGERAILNAGHSIGHALERLSHYTLRHGDAVAIGMVAELRIGEAMGISEKGLAERVSNALASLGLPVTDGGLRDAGALVAAMRSDKKNRDGRLRMAIPVAVGTMARDGEQWTIEVGEELVAVPGAG